MKKYINKALYAIFALIMCFSFVFAGCTPNDNKAVSKFIITKLPDKMEYNVGELFDPTGMELAVQYADGTTAKVTEGYTWDVTEELEEDDDEIIIEYHGRKKILEIEVNVVVPTELSISKEPDKKTYYVGERFDKTGMELLATYEDETTRTITSGFKVSPSGKLKIKDTKVKITYNKKSIEYPITVVNAPLTAISVETPPAKTTYTEGEYFDITGMVIKGTYADGTTAQITDYNYSPKTALTADVNKITITKGDFSVEQPITVNEAAKALFVTTMPTKVSYAVGDTFDATGMVVSYKESGGQLNALSASEYTLSGTEDLQIGSYVTVTLNSDSSVKVKVPIMVSHEVDVVDSMIEGGQYTDYHAKLSRDAVNGDFAGNFVKGATVTYTVNSASAGKAGITIRAASSYVTEYSSASKATWYYPIKVADVRVNTVFDVYVNGIKVPISDDVLLRGGETTDPNGDVYLLANWSYVKLENVDFVEDENTVQLVFLEQIYKNASVTVDGETSERVYSSPYIDTILVNFGECATHAVGSEYFSNDTNHWQVCQNCKDNVNVSEHVFNQQVADAKYLASAATCTELAKYYYSCVCGAKGSKTFTSGSLASHDYESKAEGSRHFEKCKVCGDTRNETSAHTYTEVVTEENGVQKISYVCACGDKYTKQSDVSVNLTSANLAGNNSIAWATGNYAYRTTAECKNSGSATVQQALEKSTNGDYITSLYGGSRIEVPVSVESDTTGTVVVKASSGWIQAVDWGNSASRTGDMQFNLVFKAYVRHSDGTTTEIVISDDVILKGATGNYTIMANWQYVSFSNVALKEGDTFVLESLTPKTADGKYVYWDGETAPKAVADASCGDGNTQSSATVDTISFYFDD